MRIHIRALVGSGIYVDLGVLMTFTHASWGRKSAGSFPGILFGLAITIAAIGLSPNHAVASPSGEKFVKRIADNIVATIKSGGSKSQKTKKFSSVFTGNADIESMGSFALGKYSKSMKGAQRTRYYKLIRPYVSRVFLRRMTDAAVDKVVIGSSRDRGKNEEIVKTSVKFSDGRPDLAISWRLRRKGGNFKVIDLLVAGVSMIKSQRDEFTAEIRRNDGNVDSLLKYMGG